MFRASDGGHFPFETFPTNRVSKRGGGNSLTRHNDVSIDQCSARQTVPCRRDRVRPKSCRGRVGGRAPVPRLKRETSLNPRRFVQQKPVNRELAFPPHAATGSCAVDRRTTIAEQPSRSIESWQWLHRRRARWPDFKIVGVVSVREVVIWCSFVGG